MVRQTIDSFTSLHHRSAAASSNSRNPRQNYLLMAPQQPVLLVDFAVYKPPEELKIDYFATQKAAQKWQVRRGAVTAQARMLSIA